MERLARLVMHHRRLVSAFWVLLFVAGAVSAGQLGDRLTLDFSLPGQPGDTAEQQLIKSYGVSSFDSYLAVVTVPQGQTVERALPALGFSGASHVRVGRLVELEVEDPSQVGEMCEKLLANPVTEDFEIATVSRA